MMEQNNINNSNNNVVKIVLAAVIGFFSLVLFAIAIIYIVSMQTKIAKLEKEQQEVIKRQLEAQNMASVQTVPQLQPQPVQQQQSQPVKKEAKKTQNTEKDSQSSEPVIFYIDGSEDEDGIVSVRLEPKEGSELIADLSNGEPVEYLGRKGEWYYVKYDGGKGYVPKSGLKR